jgi:TetR/AcrR family transcriptional regulator, transcriptional repressor for nem operon
LTHYFGGRRDLTRQIIALRARDVLESQSLLSLRQRKGLSALREWAVSHMAEVDTQYLRGGCVYGSLAGELLDGDEDVLDDLATGYEDWLRMLQNFLSEMRRRGELSRDTDPRHLAATLLAAHQGGAMLTYVLGTAEPLRLALNAAVDYIASFCTP